MTSASPSRMTVFGLLKTTVMSWLDDGALRLSAALAYYSVFSLAPLIIIAISVAGLVLGAEAVQGQLEGQLTSYIGAPAAAGIQSLVKSASKPGHGWAGAITGFITLLLGASGVFGQLKDALNTIWGIKQRPGGGVKGFIRERLLSFGMVLAIGFLLLTSLLLTTFIAALNTSLNHVLGLPAFVWAILSFVLSFGLVSLLFALIFKLLPDANVEWRNVWIGSVATACLFEVGKFGLSFYLGRESTASSYGAAGSIVVLLLWVYYASCILLLGAEFTKVYAKASGHVIKPSSNAELVVAHTSAPEVPQVIKEPRVEHLPLPVATIAPPALVRPDASAPNPIGALLAVAATTFFAALWAQRKVEQSRRPSKRIGEGFMELGREAQDNAVRLWQAARAKISRR